MKTLAIKALSCCVFIVFILLATPNGWSYTQDECIQCHREGSFESKLHVDVDKYLLSIHGSQITCFDCHADIRDNKHTEVKGLGKVDCQQCHEQQSLHSQDRTVTCWDCHTRHHIHSTEDTRSSVYWKNLRSTCGKCHPNQTKRVSSLSFLPSLHIAAHPKQNFAERHDKNMCVECHQGKAAHGEDVPINSHNCYVCHMPSGGRRALFGYIHVDADWQNQPVSFVAGYIYLIAMVVCVGILFSCVMGFLRKRR